MIAAFATAAAFAAKAATTEIPIVFGVNEDPVRLGLVASLSRPGGSATGINYLTAEVGAKRLTLLRELIPTAARVALLVNPANATSMESTLKDVLPAARVMSLGTRVLNAPQDRAGARHNRSTDAACPRRRGDRVVVFAAPAHVGGTKCECRHVRIYGEYRETSGLS